MEDLNWKLNEKTSRAIIKWKSRNLTLVVPKINHFILTISNPKIETIKNLEIIFTIFLEKKKKEKNSIIQGYACGGLKMAYHTKCYIQMQIGKSH